MADIFGVTKLALACKCSQLSPNEQIGKISSGTSEPAMEDKLPPLRRDLIEMKRQSSMVDAKQEDKIGWERTEVFFISCQSRIPENLVIVVIFSGL